MKRLIDKDALVAEIVKLKKSHDNWSCMGKFFHQEYENLLSFIDTLEVIDPYEQFIQYASIEAGIEAHAEDYSFNIESELFQQLTKEQQVLWRKEIEQAVISGGYNGIDLARDPRYKENHEVKEVDLEEIIKSHFNVKNLNDVKITTTGRNLLNLAMHINKFAMNTAFEQYSQIGESTGNDSLNEEIEKTIKMNDMWCGLMPNTLIKYTAKHFFELGLKAQKKEPKKCMYSKDDYTDEDRKVLCDGCKEECKYNKSDDFTKALAECIHQAQGSVVDPMVFAEIWKDELIKLAESEEPVSEDLGEYINELSKQFPEVSFAKLSRIAVRVAKWQKQQIKRAMDLGEPPYLISVEQAYYRTLKLLEE